jgi:beta-galactosidase
MALADIGVCYYPEHWPSEQWAEHAQNMREGGISRVRIGEFAWSRIEPAPNCFEWEWLDTAVDTLASAGLNIILCTPTACPPRWLVMQLPDILPVDAADHVREFGSRRHYRFASQSYQREATRISQAVIRRYATHPAVVGWQLDNEYGCHDTTRSYAGDDLHAFQRWLAERYGDIQALNTAWGTVFWSQEYAAFQEIGLTNSTVTEANPAHQIDFCRFASDQVVAFNRQQRQQLRDSAGPDRWVTHNFMGNFTDFDHFAVGDDLDIASWDSYPLGFLDQGWASDADKLRYRCIGHPDWAAFHHDLYRAVGRGRFAVMEQQPGPVNWAPSNAEPLASAPAFWGMEAIAHGAEFVSFFRYQQLPFAQEQMHAGLRLPNGDPAPAWAPVQQLAEHIASLPDMPTAPARVALLFDYPSCWATTVQPHAPGMQHLETAMDYYSAARRHGLNIDLVHQHSSLDGYALLMIPGSTFVSEKLVDEIIACEVDCLVGARSGSRSPGFALPDNLPPGALQRILPLRVVAVDSMRPGARRAFEYDKGQYELTRWYERIDSGLEPQLRCDDGSGLWYRHGPHHYLNAHLPVEFLSQVIKSMLSERDLASSELPEGLRLRQRGALQFAFNFSPQPRHFRADKAQRICGPELLEQGEYAIWQLKADD